MSPIAHVLPEALDEREEVPDRARGEEVPAHSALFLEQAAGVPWISSFSR